MATRQLGRSLGSAQFFTMGFGAIIGVAWVVVLGQWLDRAGPLGAMLAFAGGGVVMVLVGLCYAEVGPLLPVAGGEVAYAYQVFGVRAAYGVGWLLALANIAIVAFEAISMGWVLAVLVPGIHGPVLYHVGGGPVSAGSLLIGVLGTWLLTGLNYRGMKGAARFQDVMTWSLIALVLVFVGAGLVGGSVANLQPFFRESGSRIAWSGIASVFVAAPMWYSGFNVIPQVMEERTSGTSLHRLGQVMLITLVAAAAFYCLVILATAMVMPWPALVRMDLPVVTAFRQAFHSTVLADLILVAAILGIVTTWNTSFIAGSRVLFSFGRARLISSAFAAVHPRFGSPAAAVVFVGVTASIATGLGRTALLPIVNVGASCLATAYLVTCLAFLKLRRDRPGLPRPYRVPLGRPVAATAITGAVLMLGMTLYQPWADAPSAVPLEWLILGGWGITGVVFWFRAARRRAELSEAERAKLILGPADRSP